MHSKAESVLDGRIDPTLSQKARPPTTYLEYTSNPPEVSLNLSENMCTHLIGKD